MVVDRQACSCQKGPWELKLRSPNLRNLGRGSFDTKAPHLLSYDLVTIS
jgi:hypothetical protein